MVRPTLEVGMRLSSNELESPHGVAQTLVSLLPFSDVCVSCLLPGASKGGSKPLKEVRFKGSLRKGMGV